MSRKNRIVRLSDEEWDEIGRVAEMAKLTKAGLLRQISAHRLPFLQSAPDVMSFLSRNDGSRKSESSPV